MSPITLNLEYWFDVDHNAGRNAHEYFVGADSVYRIQDQVLTGRDAIREFYAWRAGRGERVSRHCVVNARAEFSSENEAKVWSILLLFAADGVPILPSAAPILIADVEDECVRVDGAWRYRSKRLTTLFAGGAPITLQPTR